MHNFNFERTMKRGKQNYVRIKTWKGGPPLYQRQNKTKQNPEKRYGVQDMSPPATKPANLGHVL